MMLDVARVAAIYEAAIDRSESPTKAVAEQLGIGRSLAGNLVMRAREQGLLPPTRKGAKTTNAHKIHRGVTAEIGRGRPGCRHVQLCAECLTPWPCAVKLNRDVPSHMKGC